MKKQIRKVHVIYKTHLDIGFTDYARNVKTNYMDSFIPKAIELAEKVNNEGEQKKFIWTTGSWIINECLQQKDKEKAAKLEAAINKGYIRWHGLPFTTHTELMNERSFEYGISISKKLDKQFNKHTIAAKMTDIPGHTKAIIPILARNGIKYLHIGVNPSSKLPDVPKAFLWKGKDGSELVVNYAAGYGEILELDILDQVLAFAHSGDNEGPAGEASINSNLAYLRQKYPNAVVEASTLDNFAEALYSVREYLPVVTEEIGDTWIHGIGTDPEKVSYFKELLRCAERWIEEKRLEAGSEEYNAFFNELILIPEHTWGMDLKKHFCDFRNYRKEDFMHARNKDLIENSIPSEYSYISAFTMDNEAENVHSRAYSKFEQSWKEQRQYIYNAIDCLSDDKQKEAYDTLQKHLPVYNVPEGGKLDTGIEYEIGNYRVSFANDGSINGLRNINGTIYADEEHRIGRYIYEVFDADAYKYWLEHYQRDMEQHYRWCIADFSKPGLELIEKPVQHARYLGSVENMVLHEGEGCCRIFIELKMPSECSMDYGSPEKLLLIYSFYGNGSVGFELNWFNKDANRIPEASWCEMNFFAVDETKWLMKKMGDYISPYSVISNGNRNMHSVEEIAYNSEKGIAVEPLDAPLVSIGDAKILRFDNEAASLSKGMFFNLHNNIWGTNFPMWFEEDMKYRFLIKLK
ncbi:MAG: hypothetical protein APF77_03135 [Clostridia bacterium BRH_c25]|nr:MAG: hypothetical protein APF77_03135 [Clostridia bacterium BRH_c25]